MVQDSLKLVERHVGQLYAVIAQTVEELEIGRYTGNYIS